MIHNTYYGSAKKKEAHTPKSQNLYVLLCYKKLTKHKV